MRRENFYNLNFEQINTIFKRHLNEEIQSFQLIQNGLSNTNYKITLRNESNRILRIHRKEHLGKKEYKINKLLGTYQLKKVPKIIFYDDKLNILPVTYSIIEYINGYPWTQNLSASSHIDLLNQSIEFICFLHNITFNASGILDKDLIIHPIQTENNNHNIYVNYMYDCIENSLLKKRMGNLLLDLEKCIKKNENLLNSIDYNSYHLVHGDFKKDNILIMNNTEVSGIIDWEYARSDLFYGDLATLFRGQYFTKDQGILNKLTNIFKRKNIPIIENWFHAVKIIDFINLLSFLTEKEERGALFETVKTHIENTLQFLN